MCFVTAPVTCPTTKILEREFYPDASRIAAQASQMIAPGKSFPNILWQEAPEIIQFKGPF